MAIYLGLSAFGTKREIFRYPQEPTTDSHGHVFDAVIGPFRTMRGARFMRDHGQGNPHCLCVADAERLSRKYA